MFGVCLVGLVICFVLLELMLVFVWWCCLVFVFWLWFVLVWKCLVYTFVIRFGLLFDCFVLWCFGVLFVVWCFLFVYCGILD